MEAYKFEVMIEILEEYQEHILEQWNEHWSQPGPSLVRLLSLQLLFLVLGSWIK